MSRVCSKSDSSRDREDDALERARAEGHVDRVAGLDVKAVGDAVGERLAEGRGGVDGDFGEGHCGASIRGRESEVRGRSGTGDET